MCKATNKHLRIVSRFLMRDFIASQVDEFIVPIMDGFVTARESEENVRPTFVSVIVISF